MTSTNFCITMLQTCSLTCEASQHHPKKVPLNQKNAQQMRSPGASLRIVEPQAIRSYSELVWSWVLHGASLWFLGLPFDNLRCMSRFV